MSHVESTAQAAEAPEDAPEVPTEEMQEFDRESLALDSEAIEEVQLDGLALMKIIKHCKDSHANQGSTAWGTLIGADVGGMLDVSNSFGLPGARERGEEEERNNRTGTYLVGRRPLTHRSDAVHGRDAEAAAAGERRH